MNDSLSTIGFNNHIYEMLILSALKIKDCCSYEIHKKILEYSNNKLDISPNAVYTVIYKLHKSGMLTEHKKEYKNRTRLYYHITPAGEGHLNRLLHYYWVNTTLINMVLCKLEKEYDENKPQSII